MSAEETEYRVVETSSVTEEELTRLLNEYAGRGGWTFDGFHFAMREGSHRPSMAFALFHRKLKSEEGGEMC
ncbi:MAG: DUF4177 domain-containing protein [Deltaproteobacteria bacterium]|nr:MAG: DUF4177 domain-containing protein [Deltaproteobacteria bacterium]